MNRRAVLALGGAGLLGGCGFSPLYLPASRGGVSAALLQSVYVPVIPERYGQLLRQQLQRHLEGSGDGVAKRFELVAAPALNAEGIAIQRDTSTTRIRLTATATWSLRRLDLAHTVITTGTARITDGFNILDQQFFAADLESEAATKRITETLADQIVTQLAIYLKRNPTT